MLKSFGFSLEDSNFCCYIYNILASTFLIWFLIFLLQNIQISKLIRLHFSACYNSERIQVGKGFPRTAQRKQRIRTRLPLRKIGFGLYWFGAGDRTRTGTPSLAVDFESTTSTIPSHRQIVFIVQYTSAKKARESFQKKAIPKQAAAARGGPPA